MVNVPSKARLGYEIEKLNDVLYKLNPKDRSIVHDWLASDGCDEDSNVAMDIVFYRMNGYDRTSWNVVKRAARDPASRRVLFDSLEY